MELMGSATLGAIVCRGKPFPPAQARSNAQTLKRETPANPRESFAVASAANNEVTSGYQKTLPSQSRPGPRRALESPTASVNSAWY